MASFMAFQGRKSPWYRYYGIIAVALLLTWLWAPKIDFTFLGNSEPIPKATKREPSLPEGYTSKCSNSCSHRSNGVCDEGRFPTYQTSTIPQQDLSTSYLEVHCDLGTDCEDCGEWVFDNSTVAEFYESSPVADIKAKQLRLFVRETATPIPFIMPFTDPAVDIDVSAQIRDTGLIEPGLTWLWYRLLADGCGRGAGGVPGKVVDVGANFGYYSLLAASMGCQVLSFEPVPHFAAYFKYAILRNHFQSLIKLRENVVSNEQDALVTMIVPKSGILGTAGIDGMNLDDAQLREKPDRILKRAETIDSVITDSDTKILIMKVDVEGFEPSVLASAKHLLSKRSVENIIMEYSPGVAEHAQDWKLSESNAGKLLGLVRNGYKAYHLNEDLRSLNDFGWSDALPSLPLIVEKALIHDVEDALSLQNGTLGCPLPSNVEAAMVNEQAGPEAMFWNCSSSSPAFEFERLHPQGFRPTFGHNTNVWLTLNDKKSAQLATASGTASLFPEEWSIKDYFSPTGYSYVNYPWHSRRVCSEIPPHYQVKFRCPCTEVFICGELEEEVLEAAKGGLMPPLLDDGRVQKVDASAYDVENW